MPSLNKVMLIGNLTRDPEVRFTPKGSAVVELGMAMNRKYRLESGEEREEVTYADVTFFGKQAETLGKWMKKGRPIYVEGRLRLDSWDDKETGKKQYRLRVQGEEFQFLGSGRDDEGGGGGGGGESQRSGGYAPRSNPPQQQQQRPQSSQAPQQPQKTNEPDYGDIDGDEIPF